LPALSYAEIHAAALNWDKNKLNLKTRKTMSDWLSFERKRINEIIASSRKDEPKIVKHVAAADETLIESVGRPDQFSEAHVIFDVIGITGNTDTCRSSEKVAAHDVIDTLYEQYCRALDNPLAVFSSDWNPIVHEARVTAASDDETRLSSRQHAESIEDVISGARGIEDFFGALEKGNSPPVFAAAPVPEILHLFAPLEFKACETRLPSALVRREHHAPGIDSPLYAPRRVISESAL
jgi:hypothetical protein